MWLCDECGELKLKKKGSRYVRCSNCQRLRVVDMTAMYWYEAETKRHEAGRKIGQE